MHTHAAIDALDCHTLLVCVVGTPTVSITTDDGYPLVTEDNITQVPYSTNKTSRACVLIQSAELNQIFPPFSFSLFSLIRRLLMMKSSESYARWSYKCYRRILWLGSEEFIFLLHSRGGVGVNFHCYWYCRPLRQRLVYFAWLVNHLRCWSLLTFRNQVIQQAMGCSRRLG